MIHALEPGPDRIVFQITDVVPSADVPRVSHLCSLTAVSWSMFPTIQKGDVLEIEPVGLVQVGDIVVFSLEDALVCHRVVGFAGREMVHTQGDAVAAQDRPVRLQEISGRVTTIIRGSGRFAPVSALPHRSPPSRAAENGCVLDRTSRTHGSLGVGRPGVPEAMRAGPADRTGSRPPCPVLSWSPRARSRLACLPFHAPRRRRRRRWPHGRIVVGLSRYRRYFDRGTVGPAPSRNMASGIRRHAHTPGGGEPWHRGFFADRLSARDCSRPPAILPLTRIRSSTIHPSFCRSDP